MLMIDWLIIFGIAVGGISGGLFGYWLVFRDKKEFEDENTNPFQFVLFTGFGVLSGGFLGLFLALIAIFFPVILAAILVSITIIIKMEQGRKTSMVMEEIKKKEELKARWKK